MKRIGILSMQEVHNYGSYLQAFALKKTIENCIDADVDFVPIEQGILIPEYRRSIRVKIKKSIERFFHIDFLRRLRYNRLYHRRFAQEFVPELIGNSHKGVGYDTVVIGSDEVFHFAQLSPWGFTTQLYGDVPNANRVISYAASFGATTLDIIDHHGLREEISNAMSKLAAVSVRDRNSFNIASALVDMPVNINVDPVLLFDYKGYIKEPDDDNFIVVYTYPNRIKRVEEVNAIKTFAHKTNKKIITIGFYFPWSDETVVPHPFEVLGYIKKAAYVVTDTFHGCVMSIICNKQFVAIARDSNRNKMLSLLADYKLENQLVGQMDELESKAMTGIAYSKVNEIIESKREAAMNYLKQYL